MTDDLIRYGILGLVAAICLIALIWPDAPSVEHDDDDDEDDPPVHFPHYF